MIIDRTPQSALQQATVGGECMSTQYRSSIKLVSVFCLFIWKGFQQSSHTHHVQQQAQTAAMEGLLTKMGTLQQTSDQGNQNVQQVIQDLGVQVKQGKPTGFFILFFNKKLAFCNNRNNQTDL